MRVPSRVVVLLALLSAWLSAGCSRDGVPPLVEVTEISPREIELGDRLELKGAGFPQGRTARVTFRGTMYRPGQSELRGATVETEGVDRTNFLVKFFRICK